jgi:uncharacterized repeat protein (TIGR01451 family)
MKSLFLFKNLRAITQGSQGKQRKKSKRVAGVVSAIALGFGSQLSLPQVALTQTVTPGVVVGTPSSQIINEGCLAANDTNPNPGDTITIATNLSNNTTRSQAFRVVFRATALRGGTTRSLSEDLFFGGPTYMNRNSSIGGVNWDDSYGQVTNTPTIATGGKYTVKANFGINTQQMVNALGLASGQSAAVTFQVEVFNSDFSAYYGTASVTQNVTHRSSSDCGGNRAVNTNTTAILLTANKTAYTTSDTITIENATIGANDTTTTPSTSTGSQLPSWGDTLNDIVDIIRLEVPPTGDPDTDYLNNSGNIAATLSTWTRNDSLDSGFKLDEDTVANYYYSKIVGSSLTANTNYASFSASTLTNNKYYLVRMRSRLGTNGVNSTAGSASHPILRPQYTYFAVGDPAPIGAPQADVVTTKTGPTTAVAGSTVTYNITTINNGPSAAANVIVSDNIGTGLTNVVASNGGTYNSTTGIVTFPAVASLANGATQTNTVSFTAPASGSVTDIVSSTSSTSDPTPANNDGTATTAKVTTAITASADVVTTKTGPTTAAAGSTVSYNITTRNNGPSDATNVVVRDNIGTGLIGVVASNGGTYNLTTGIVTFPTITTLANGATQNYTVSFIAPLSGSVTDIVSSTSSTSDPTPTNNDGTAPAAKVTTAIGPSADLSIIKTDGQTSTNPGTSITYTITVTNNGPSTVTSITVNDTLPASIQNPTFTASTGIYNSSTGAWTGLNLAAGQSITLTVKGTVSSSATGTITNTATVTAPTGVTDPATSNNTATDTTTVNSVSKLILVKRITAINGNTTNGIVDLTRVVDDPNTQDDNNSNWPANYLKGAINGGKVKPGDDVEYTIYFLSSGNTAVKNVSVCDLVPTYTTYVADAFASGSGMSQAIGSTTTNLTNANDITDGGQFIPSGTQAPGSCNKAAFLGTTPPPPLPAAQNLTGAVVVDVVKNSTTLPDSAPGSAAYGFIRFRVKVK